MAKHYKDWSQEELIAEIKEVKAELRRKTSALDRILGYAKSGNLSAVKAAAGNAVKPKRQ
ncbi:hypothetical protein MHZ92_20025 [Sporosarcina sp. ACRSL]|uniref:hypothetical protein n=1 Tax=Sporosarcina sp. ACRSL TaxID=2918215 RepID=UPI001EF5A96D|nr:hypothetical protein [Sporosarcina sp. ACRSL]MCG7346397.1 hypothetical protein [Sporosarcina sp. ACRSL]